MLKPLRKGPFVCVNCGYPFNPSLVKVYGQDSKKYEDDFGGADIIDDDSSSPTINPLNVNLSECPRCHQPVDFYLQMDNCLLILNAILLKTSFFRHIVHNCCIPKSLPLKLFIVYSFCETYKNWNKLHSSATKLTYNELESMFYTLFLRFLAINSVFFFFIYIVFAALGAHRQTIDGQRFIPSLIICSFSKLYKLPVTLWPSESQTIVDLLLEVTLFSSLVQCCRVSSHHSIGKLNASLKLLTVYMITWFVNKSF